MLEKAPQLEPQTLLLHLEQIRPGEEWYRRKRTLQPLVEQWRSQALITLRFCCAPWAFAFIREGLQRYPIEHTRFSKPLPGDSWWHHPYPVELDLPSWTVAADIDLRSWLVAFGGGISIESPDALRQELVDRCREAIGANGSWQPISEPAERRAITAQQFFQSVAQ